MSNRRWLPTDYQDEVIPPPRESPSAWVVTFPGDAFALAPIDDSADRAPHILRDGDVVAFDWTVALGRGSISVAADEEWDLDITEPRAPEGALLYVVAEGDIDTLSPSAADIASALDEGIHDIRFYAWSHAATPFVFRNGAFHPAADRASTTES